MQPTLNSQGTVLPGIDADRRRWLMAGSAAAIGASVSGTLPRLASGAENDWMKLPYIDAHSHVWSPDVARWPLAGQQTRADLKPLSFTPEELFKLAEPEGVGRVVLDSAQRLSPVRQCISDRLCPAISGAVQHGGHDRRQSLAAGREAAEAIAAGRSRAADHAADGRRGVAGRAGDGAICGMRRPKTGQAMCCLIDAS